MEKTNEISQEKKTVHHGRNLKNLRELMNKDRKELCGELNITQRALSEFEGQEEISEPMLRKIAKALHIPVEALKNMTEDDAKHMIINTFTNHDFKDSATANSGNGRFYYTNNCGAADKLMAIYDEQLADKRKIIDQLETILIDMNEQLKKYRE